MTAALIVALAAQSAPVSLCTLCHPDVRVQFEQSVHSVEGLGCVACHGGNEKASTVEAAHRGRFRGVPRRRDTPALCASCHSDVEKMRPYNLPVDQMALYRTSRHGVLLAEGDENVAVCTDCHGTHEILKTDDPRSSVFLWNIPRTCARCHSDEGFLKAYGLENDPYEDFRQSVHGRALFEDGNSAAPDCSRCHGAHGAAPPGLGDVNKVCGQCHSETRAYFREGPHAGALDAAGHSECVSCHDHHRVDEAKMDMLDSVCSNCHEPDSGNAEIARKMKALFTLASEEIEQARRMVDHAAAVPLYVEDYRARLEEARTSLLESLPVMHSLDVGRVELLTGRARSVGQEVESEVSGKLEERRWNRILLMVFWFYLLLTIAILVRLRRRAAREVGA